jgi:hypothetical protein
VAAPSRDPDGRRSSAQSRPGGYDLRVNPRRPGLSLRRLAVPAAFLAVAWAFFLWIPGRNVVLAADVLRFRFPWFRGGTLPWNQLLTDPVFQFYPWLTGFRQGILSGRFPLWDPTMQSGVPIAANPQSSFFFPLTWLVLPLGVGAGMSAMAILRPALAAFFTYLYLRRARRSTGAALFGAIVYGFSLPLIVWAEYPLDNVFLLAPLLLLAIDGVVRRPEPARVAAVVAVSALVLVGGHPESVLHVGVLAGCYAVVQGVRYRRGRVRAAAWLAASVLWSGALTLFILLPQARVVLDSAALEGAEHAAPVMPIRMLVGAILPKFFTAGQFHVPTRDVPWNLSESACYFGLAALALAAAAVRRPPRPWRIPGPVFWLAVLAAAFALVFVAPRFPAFQAIPLLGRTFHNRLAILAGLPIAVLSSDSCDRLTRSPRCRAIFVAALVSAAAATWALPLVLCGRSAGVTQLETALIVLAASSAALLLRNRKAAAIGLLCMVELGDLWLAGSGYHALVAPSEVYPRVGFVAALRGWESGGRTLPFGLVFPPNSLSVYDLHDVRGYDALESSRYRESRRSLAIWRSDGMSPVIAVGFTPETARRLQLFAVKALVLPPRTAIGPAVGPEISRSLSLAYRGPDATIYRVDGPGRFQAIGRVVPATSKTRPASGAESAVAGIAHAMTLPEASNASIRVVRDEPEAIELETSCPGDFFLRISDAFDDGWHGTIDGRRLSIYRADGAFRGVIIPAGNHRIAMRYRLPGSPATFVISLGAAALLVVFLVRRRSRVQRAALGLA